MAKADTSVKYFHSAMPGAPVLNGTAGSLIAVLDACLVNGFGLKTVDSLVVAGNVATATISTGHSAEKDVVVLIAGATPAELNGEWKVTSTTTTTISFVTAGILDQMAAGTLAVLVLSDPCGTVDETGLHLTAPLPAQAAEAGLIRWARIVDGDDNFVLDGDVRLPADSDVGIADFIIDVAQVYPGSFINLVAATLAEGG